MKLPRVINLNCSIKLAERLGFKLTWFPVTVSDDLIIVRGQALGSGWVMPVDPDLAL